MARSNDKELLQCLAFAYFAEHPLSGSSKHQEQWEDIFNRYVALKDIVLDIYGKEETIKTGTRITQEFINKINNSTTPFFLSSVRKMREGEAASRMEKEYGEHLRKSFEFSFMVKKFSNKITQQKNGRITNVVQPKLKIAYKVAQSFVSTRIVDGNLSDYQFLDQDDPFMIRVKDDSLKKIHDIFSLSGSFQMLSPVDMFCVKKGMKDIIQRDFEKNIIDASEKAVLSNMSYGTLGRNTFRTITNKYFHERDLIPISLKFPKTIDAVKNTKIVGSTMLSAHLIDFIDPYGKLLGEMMKDGVNVTELIKKAITINFNEFRIDSNLASWEYPVTFNYNQIVDKDTKEPLHKTKLKFELLTWSNQGFNGRWIIGGQKTTWVSGMGIGTTEKVLFNYPEYGAIVAELIVVRRKVFQDMAPEKTIPLRMKNQYDSALRELSNRIIITTKKMKETDKFFARYMRIDKEATASNYRFNVILELTKNMKTNLPKRNPAYNGNHFNASQLAYFLFRGSNRSETLLFLKKRIFLSIFGMLTKSGYKIFDSDGENTVMRNYIKQQFMKNGTKVEAYFNAAPFVLLS